MRDRTLYAAMLLVGFCLGAVTAQPDTQEPPRAKLPVVAQPPAPVEQLGDGALFERLKARIDQRIEAKLIEGLDDAEAVQAGVARGPFGTLLAGKLLSIVGAMVKAAIGGLVLAALVALLWKYWWVVGGLLTAVMFVSGATARLSAKGNAKP